MPRKRPSTTSKKKNSKNNRKLTESNESILDIKALKKHKEGHVFKNYKEMTEILSMKYLNGKSKEYQLDYIQNNIFTYEKEGHKIIIKKFYNMKDIEEGLVFTQFGVNGLAEKLVMHIIGQHSEVNSNKVLVLSKNFFAKSVALINFNYQRLYGNLNYVSSETKVRRDSLEDFLNRHNSSVSYMFNKVANNLKRKFHIQINPAYYAVLVDPSVKNKVSAINDKYFLHYNREEVEEVDNYSVPVEISTATYKEINAIETIVLHWLGCSNVSESIKRKRYNKYKELSTICIKHMLGIEYYFQAYQIHYYKDIFDQVVNWDDYALTQEERELFTKKINQFSKNNVVENAQKRIERKEEKEGFSAKEIQEKRKRVLDDFKATADIFIDQNTSFTFLNSKKKRENKGDG